jgi:hypothetical protein
MGATARGLLVVASVAAVTNAALLVPGGSAAADAGDGPDRVPSLAWERTIECHAGTRCELGAVGDTLLLHRAGAGGARGPGELHAFDVVTGDERWRSAAQPATEWWLTQQAVILGNKRHVEVFDPVSGEVSFAVAGSYLGSNAFGTIVVESGDDVVVIAGATGEELWRAPREMTFGGICRDIVVLVPRPRSDPAPYRVVEQHTGEERWYSRDDYDATTGDLACGGQFVYSTDGSQLRAYHAPTGWTEWVAELPDGAGAIELYREVALVAATDGTGEVTAVDREHGDVLWSLPGADLGDLVSSQLRLRRDDTGVFTLHPPNGVVVHRLDPAAAADGVAGDDIEVVGLSDTRIVVASPRAVATYGVNDLGLAWSLDLNAPPDDVVVSDGTLVVRTGDRLAGYR